jgi:RHS repeat-associated protein
MRHTVRLKVIAAVMLLIGSSPALAQIVNLPSYRNLDENGVDLGTGTFVMNFEEAAIGTGSARLPVVRVAVSDTPSQWDAITFRRTVKISGSTVRIGLPGQVEDSFTAPLNGGSVSDLQYGETLDQTPSGYTYSVADGSKIDFDYQPNGSNFCQAALSGCVLIPSRIVYPNGNTVTFTHDIYLTSGGTAEWRIAKIANTFGYAINFTYQTGGTSGGASAPAGWHTRASAVFQKATATQFTIGYAYPSSSVVDVTAPDNGVWRFTPTSIRRPGETSPGFSVTGSPVTSVTRDGVTTTYALTTGSGTATMVKTNPLGQTATVVIDTAINRPTSVTIAGKTTSYQYDTPGRLKRVTKPEGNYVDYVLDDRGNTKETHFVAKLGTLPEIVTTASFPPTCANQLNCNKPSSTTDARGKTTDYTYDPTHGGPLTVTEPDPGNNVRPQTRYTYNIFGGVYQLSKVSQCQTQNSCAGNPADETKTTVDWDTAGNPTGVTQADGSGTLVTNSFMTYNDKGDRLTLNGPLAGAADTTAYRYDAARRLVGVISPDPDGAGALPNRAVRATYDTAGRTTKTERGTVPGQTDADWANFAMADATAFDFDANSRVKTQTLTSGGSAYALIQFSYDALGRLDCQALRMNRSAFTPLPTSACSLGTEGADGPDRITQTLYDQAGRYTQTREAVGVTNEVADERILTYTDNGLVATIKDAENNLTTYQYDGFDRLSKTLYPTPLPQGAGTSNTGDYEQLTYDPAGNVLTRKVRSGVTIAFTYDGLNRPTLKDLPGTEPDVTYTYDNLDRLVSASQGAGTGVNFTYDALSRNLTQDGPRGTVCSEWDSGGRRTRLRYPGPSNCSSTFYIDYNYLVTGETTKLSGPDANGTIGMLATLAYDDLGRRSSLTFVNGASQGYTYDPVSRLKTLTSDLANTASDLTQTFGYTPASQVRSVVRTNDAYAWTGHGNGTTISAANGLNQVTTVGGATVEYNGNANLKLDPTTAKTYTYTSENLLKTATGGVPAVTATYDPLMRLYDVIGNASGTGTRWAYDGLEMIAEYNAANALQRRFVFGPAVDEPLVQYEGTGTTDRRFLHADERGSIVAVSDSVGTKLSINTYDEYGKPGAANVGRFQYTGQAWLPEVGADYYKTRIYAPQIGRFLQPDPIGYADSPNLYAYVLNDPTNLVDPLGLSGWCGKVWADVCGRRNTYNVCDVSCYLQRIPQTFNPFDFRGLGKTGGGRSRAGQTRRDDQVQCPAASPGSAGNQTAAQVNMERPGWQVVNAGISALHSLSEAERLFPDSTWNGPGDAWRHFRWSFAMTSSMNSTAAAAFANSHEVSNPSTPGETSMDNYNNAVGRAFGADPTYSKLSPNDAANLALRSGCLQTSPGG